MRASTTLVAWLGLLAWTSGCRSDEEKFDTGGLDRDGDGAPLAIDCDDDNPAISPDNEELCNGFDDDCDGLIDEDDALDATTWYADADGDGFGGPDFSETACVAPGGWVEDNTDCDDGDVYTYPGAAENEPPPYGSDALCMRDADGDGFGDAGTVGSTIAGQDCDDSDEGVNPNADEACDGVDTNCDGLPIADEEDGDGDRYVSCDRADGDTWRGESSISGGSDCDDANNGASPGATEVCDNVDNDCDDVVDEDDAVDAAFWYLDNDGDGYGDADISTVSCDAGEGWVLDATDCNDGAATSYPGAIEYCDDDDEDDDCDGEADEDDAIGRTYWGRDADTDGWADLDAVVLSCDPPAASWIAINLTDDEDCDDTDAAISPDATEVCDDQDNDCDGNIDEADADDATVWYADADADGYGNEAITTAACDEPSGYVSNDDDCDDTSSAVSPAALEYCNTIDDNCDGDIDEDSAVDATTWYLDYDGDGYGGDSWSIVTCEAPSDFVASSDDCNDVEATAYPGAEEVCRDGIEDNDCDDTTTCALDAAYTATDLDAHLDGPSADLTLGTTLASIGDHNQDGFPDLVVGAAGGNRVYVVSGPLSAGNLASATIARWDGATDDGVGTAVAGGNLDNRNGTDLIVGIPGSNELAIVLGPSTGTNALSTADYLMTDRLSEDGTFATSVAMAGDIDGNGLSEVLVGQLDASSTGQAWLLESPSTSFDMGDCSSYSGCVELTTSTTLDGFASVMATAEDLDADGIDEFVVAAPLADSSAGLMWLVTGPLSGTLAVDVDGTELYGADPDDRAGTDVAAAGDVNGDGYGDLLVGAPGADNNAGEVYLVMGPISGPVDLAAADFTLSGASGEGVGDAVSSAGDLDSDGHDDIVVGSAALETTYVFFGPVTGDMDLTDAPVQLTVTDASATGFGSAVVGPGDVDGDGFDDLFASSPDYAIPAHAAGSVWFLRGKGP